jgi:hypothetical protein
MPKSVKGVMDEWKARSLHSGSPKGPVVKSQKQAIAIALSEQRQQGKPMATPRRPSPRQTSAPRNLHALMDAADLPNMHTSKHH